jgi:phosphate transport system permease protein
MSETGFEASSFLPPPVMPSLARRGHPWFTADKIVALVCRIAAVGVLVMLASLLIVLIEASLPAIKSFGPRFLVETEWRANPLEVQKRDAAGKIVYDADDEPIIETIPPVFGAAPVIWGTVVSSAIALVFAIPLSFGTALFLVRIAPSWLKPGASFLIEFLAAIPSIAYGIWGLVVLAPFLRDTLERGIAWVAHHVHGLGWLLTDPSGRQLAMTGRDMLCGGLILGIMILPIITAISRDVLNAVPRAQIEGTLALGATWWQSAKQMLGYSRAGLFGATMLGLARAAGETMAVTMVIGNSNQIALSPLAPAQTMSSLLATQFQESSDIQRAALTEVALILLVMSLLFNVVARYLVVGKNSRSAAAH